MANTTVLTGMDPVRPDKVKHGQVYHATHKVDPYNSSADKRLSYMHRSFISFSFGGKQIEDFDLIAVTENNRLQRNGSGAFEDLTTTYEVIDGQFYWGTHFTNNQLDLVLATDGITEDKLDEFKHWFAGDATRELILAEHPNRAIMARVATPPVISMLPFEEETEVVIQDLKYPTSVTVYRGNILLSFVMDEPFWYSKVNIFGEKKDNNGFWNDNWTDANNATIQIFDENANIYSRKDALKIIKEDGVPVSTMLQAPVLLGNNLIANPDFTIVGAENEGPQVASGADIVKVDGIAVAGASPLQNGDNVGFIGPKIIDLSSNSGLSLTSQTPLYLYYPGTAPEYPIISFTFTVHFNNENYIDAPRNIFTNSTTSYDTITLTNAEGYKTYLKFTLPGIYYAYNQAIKIFNENSNLDKVNLRILIRDKVCHPVVRKLAIENIEKDNFVSGLQGSFLSTHSTMQVIINCKTGEVEGHFGSLSPEYGTMVFSEELTENAADMIRSNYLVIEGKDYFNARGQITQENVHEISFNGAQPLENFSIQYKYRYY